MEDAQQLTGALVRVRADLGQTSWEETFAAVLSKAGLASVELPP